MTACGGDWDQIDSIRLPSSFQLRQRPSAIIHRNRETQGSEYPLARRRLRVVTRPPAQISDHPSNVDPSPKCVLVGRDRVQASWRSACHIQGY